MADQLKSRLKLVFQKFKKLQPLNVTGPDVINLLEELSNFYSKTQDLQLQVH